MTGLTTTYDIPLPTTDNPTETCIARDIFRILPLEVQRDYGLYYELPDAETRSSNEICFCLCTTNSWIPAVEMKYHLRVSTSKGLVVTKDIMDLVDILVTLHEAEQSRSAPPTVSNHINSIVRSGAWDDNTTLQDWPWNQTTKIQDISARLRKEISDSQFMIREAAADVFETQTRLSRETSHQTEMTSLMSAIIGAHAVHRHEERVLLMGNTIPPTAAASHPLYHASSIQGVDSNRVHSQSFLLPKTASGSIDHTYSTLKRSRGTYEDFFSQSPHTTPSPEENTSGHPFKRGQLDNLLKVDTDSTPAMQVSLVEGTILTNVYTSDDDDTEDNSNYSPSSGTETESAIVNQEEVSEVAAELSFWASDNRISSASVNSLDEPGFKLQWNTSYSSEQSASDSIYEPPDWTHEGVLEALESLDMYEPHLSDEGLILDDVASRGPISGSGLTSDDSENDHYDVATLHRSRNRWGARSLGNLLHRDNQFERIEYDPDSGKYFFKDRRDAEWYAGNARVLWRNLLIKLKDQAWMGVDVDARISDIVARDRWVFDDKAWRYFEDPNTLLWLVNHPDEEDQSFTFASDVVDFNV